MDREILREFEPFRDTIGERWRFTCNYVFKLTFPYFLDCVLLNFLNFEFEFLFLLVRECSVCVAGMTFWGSSRIIYVTIWQYWRWRTRWTSASKRDLVWCRNNSLRRRCCASLGKSCERSKKKRVGSRSNWKRNLWFSYDSRTRQCRLEEQQLSPSDNISPSESSSTLRLDPDYKTEHLRQ